MFHSIRPVTSRLRRLAGLPPRDFFRNAEESWQISPAETIQFRPAYALPGQVERIAGTMFASMADTVEALTRDGAASERATRAWRLRGVDLIDGVLYHGGGEYHLRTRRNRFGLARRPRSETSGALYETWTTNRWFGSWLMDATLAHGLAAAEGPALTTAPEPAPGGHQAAYEQLIGMTPQRLPGDVHFRELVLFDDLPNNGGKAARAKALRRRLLDAVPPVPVPGVFLLRGEAGDRRVLANERQLADSLAESRGFLVMDPLQVTVEDLIRACGAARAIVGVEGSHLVHGITVAPEGAAIVPIQPPQRVAATLKQMTDRLDQRFGLLVAEGNDTDFTLARDDLFATLDLFD